MPRMPSGSWRTRVSSISSSPSAGRSPGTASVLEQYGGFCLEGDPLYGAYLTRQIARLRRRAEGIRESRGEETQALLSLAAQLEEKKEVWQHGGRA